ncbi:MAG: hypothetical protein KBF80_08975 [Flavobacteriales bacterium]|nr:hypothetical protein [Flavobacteriales bacterium]
MRNLLIALLLFLSAKAVAQDSTAYVQQEKAEPNIPFKDRIWFGGGIGLSFGTVTVVQIDPVLGYYLEKNRKLSVGLGPSYSYLQDNRFAPPFEMSTYGYRLFSRWRAIEQAYLHAEFLHMNMEPYFNHGFEHGRIWVPHLLVGAGYVQPIGGRSSFYLQVLFEVLQDPNSYYVGQGPILSGGVGIGF